MLLQKPVQLLPHLGVFELAVAPLPAALFPVAQPPVIQGVHDILTVGIKLHGARLLERLEPFDDARELHAVVRRVLFAAGELLDAVSVAQDGRPAAGAGIAGACPVGIQNDILHISP